MDTIDPDILAAARRIVRDARRLVVFTGAGVSADSGVPTFRGASADALWGKYDPAQLASPEGFLADPNLVYDWYSWRRRQLRDVRPNPAHDVIARWQRDRGTAVITQNVDGLHERVAPPDAAIHRLHGTLTEDRCMRCPYREPVDLADLPPLRLCPRCGSQYLRPAVVWFGETLDPQVWQAAEAAVASADAMLVVGTSGSVWPAAGLVETTGARGVPVVVVNAEPGPLDRLAVAVVHGRASLVVPALGGA